MMFIVLLFSLPLQALIAALIAISSGFPVLFRQKRIGKDGVPFIMYKFRTMICGAETKQGTLRTLNESDGPTFKIHDDPRFTGIGKLLSHAGLDELPQLINVLRGEMALIGPRPLPIAEAKKLKPWMRERERVLPGIISPAILTGSYHNDFAAWMKSDVSYARHKTARGDTLIIFHFIPFVGKLIIRAARNS